MGPTLQNKRTAPRKKRRLICELETASQRKQGIVLNLSETGLFVQTMLVPPSDEDVIVHIENTEGGDTLLLRTRLIRIRQVPAQLVSISPRGLGLRIVSAPAEYRALVWRDDVEQGDGLEIPPSPVPKPAGSLPSTPAPQSEPAPEPPRSLRSRTSRKSDKSLRSRPRTSKTRKSDRTLRPPPVPDAPELIHFRVRVSQIGSPRSRTLSVQAGSEQEAALRVHEELGAEWTIKELVPE